MEIDAGIMIVGRAYEGGEQELRPRGVARGITEEVAVNQILRELYRSPFEMFTNETVMNGMDGGGETVGVEQVEMAVGACGGFFVEHAPEVLLLMEVEVQLVLPEFAALLAGILDIDLGGHGDELGCCRAGNAGHEGADVGVALEGEDVVEVVNRALHAEGGVTEDGVDGRQGLGYHEAGLHEVAAVGGEAEGVGGFCWRRMYATHWTGGEQEGQEER